MAVSTVAHLNFTGDARQALEFYHSVFGGQLMIATYGQLGVPQDSADSDTAVFSPLAAASPDADHVAFGMVAADNGFRVAAYDVFAATGSGLACSSSAGSTRRADGLMHTESSFVLLTGETAEEISTLWQKLADGATVIQSLAPAPWAPTYGMLTDRFGVTWIFGIAGCPRYLTQRLVGTILAAERQAGVIPPTVGT
jgi:PhnB protein